MWDIQSNKEILLQHEDLVSIQQFLTSDYNKTNTLELSNSRIAFNTNRKDLIHLIERKTFKILTLHQDTLHNLIYAKYIFLFSARRADLADKANDVINIFNNIIQETNITEIQLSGFYENILQNMIIPDRLFLGELISKFPNTILSILNV